MYHPLENNYSGDRMEVEVEKVKIITSDNINLYIQIGHYHGTYLTDRDVNREGMKIVFSGIVSQTSRLTTGNAVNRVFVPAWQLFLETGTTGNSVSGGTSGSICASASSGSAGAGSRT